MDGELVALRNALEEIDITGDQVGFGDDAQTVAFVFGEDFEQAAGDAHAAFDRLIGIGGCANDDLLGWVCRVDAAEFLLEEPGGVFLEVDLALEGEGPGLLRDVEGSGSDGGDGVGLEELVGVAGEAVFAAELAAAIGVDGPRDPRSALGGGAVEDGACLHGFELDEVAVVGVGGLGGEAGHADGGLLEDGE